MHLTDQLNFIQDGAKKAHLTEICYTYPKWLNLADTYLTLRRS